jgi:hypothetical protein
VESDLFAQSVSSAADDLECRNAKGRPRIWQIDSHSTVLPMISVKLENVEDTVVDKDYENERESLAGCSSHQFLESMIEPIFFSFERRVGCCCC